MKDRGGGWRQRGILKAGSALVRQVSRPIQFDLGKIVATDPRQISDFAGEGSARSLLISPQHSMKTNPPSLALIALLFLVPTAARSQTVARVKLSAAENITKLKTEDRGTNPAACAIDALKRLEKDVLVYRSLGEFEENGKLVRVSFDRFKNDLREVTAEVEPLLSRLPQSKLKSDLSNALDSYRDGAWWWQKIDQPRVVHVSALAFAEATRTSSDAALLANVPYTVAIHWRQADKYLKRAEEMNAPQNRER